MRFHDQHSGSRSRPAQLFAGDTPTPSAQVLEVGVVPEVGIPGMLVQWSGGRKHNAMWVDDEDGWNFLAPPLKKKSKKAPARE